MLYGPLRCSRVAVDSLSVTMMAVVEVASHALWW